jgi:type I restriction enzyme S subunit
MVTGILHPCLMRIQIDRNLALEEWVINFVNNSSFFIENVKLESNSTIIDVIYGGTLKEIVLPVPSLKVQAAIIHHIETETARIDAKIAKTQRIIELQKEYRTALISEVVTGKIKVSHLAEKEITL